MEFICFILAGFFKAVADTLADHFEVSVFKKLNSKFWNKSVSSEHAKYLPFTKYKWDAWHLANSGEIVSFCSAFGIAISKHYPHYAFGTIAGVAASGLVFILSFNLFYNKILR